MDKHTLNLTRCDRCPANALVEIFLSGNDNGEADLKLCKHHFELNEDKLRAAGALIYSEIDKLTEPVKTG